ncbi:hypothetical protein MRB53_033214 [Persea americana]|uniref:Uncharacterized protein n=1 Tax=Persea americana TaxID=3435 RepID=A0ACC2KTW5_PERAE|nr:hypothetical protein MRB53_033214 [Persea americana]|eukprot:TRINITY_DN2620_c0_g1_i1.p1 TRINITY_DN2620_c0_g1~~TRINITY_DN2620_c0_g1_i1.p1  ORF type:complete len:304 (-),score=71.54 TRINITY_DN2620_c0_g1_i1:412-1323(-)
MEVKDSMTARKVQKADREKLRRDRLNEQFLELGKALDPDRPKNDKATILTDTVQMLKDLTAQVNRLKDEYGSLSEESRELSQEKNELREEKAALKSDIDNLNVQYQQRLRVMFPWTSMDPSVVMGPPTYSFPMPVPVPPGPIPMHPSLQPFPFFSSPNPGALPNPCSTFLPYSSLGNPQMEQPSTYYMPPHSLPTSRSQSASKQDSRSKSSDRQRGSNVEKSIDSNDVATELELKTPGSSLTTHLKSVPDQELSSEGRKGKHWSSPRKASGVTDESCSSRCSSSRAPQDSSSNSVGDGSVAKK